MVDIFTKAKRHEIMSRVRSSDTAPEIRVRAIIHRLGLRFRLHCKELPGKPDIVLPRHRKIVFVHGCFWHGHPNCKRATVPSTNTDFWASKIDANKQRDRRVVHALRRLGWSVLIVWQCEIAHADKLERKIRRFFNLPNK